MQIEHESQKYFDPVGLRTKHLICCQISSSKIHYILFQHKMFFNPVKEIFK